MESESSPRVQTLSHEIESAITFFTFERLNLKYTI